MIYPKGIKKGDTIGIVAPSGPFKAATLEEIENALNNLGYNVKFGKSCYGSYKGYLSSEDYIRAKDIEDMFLDKDVDGIFCIRGGYGTPRILDLIDYNIINENPKFFVGFSDITGLHVAFNRHTDLVTFHGIMAGTSHKWDEFTYNSLINALNNNVTKFENPNNEPIYTVVEGICEGELIGGNLALLVSAIGSKYEIDTKGKILFINAVDEVKREKTISTLEEQHIEKIFKAYKEYKNVEGFAKVVSNEDILNNGATLNISQYVSRLEVKDNAPKQSFGELLHWK